MKSVHAGIRSQEDIEDLIFDYPLGYQSLERYLQEKEAEENDGIDEEAAGETQSFLQKGSYGSLSLKNFKKRDSNLQAKVILGCDVFLDFQFDVFGRSDEYKLMESTSKHKRNILPPESQ